MTRSGPAAELERLTSVAQSLAAEAAGITRKLKGVRVVVVVYTGSDAAVRHVLEPSDRAEWDAVASRLHAVSEEIREQQREPRP